MIEIDRVRPDESQPRRTFEDERQRELADSVMQLGILQPVAVRYVRKEKLYRIISGERRYRAALATGLAELPCWVQEPEEKDILVRQITENWQRSDLHPMDLAYSLARLRDTFGYSQKRIAELTAKSEAEVSKFLKLLEINPAVQEQARRDLTGEVSRRHLLAIAREPVEEQVGLFEEVREKKLTAAETERLVRDRRERRAGQKPRGARVGDRYHFRTTLGAVLVTFRRHDTKPEDVRAALGEALAQVESKSGSVTE